MKKISGLALVAIGLLHSLLALAAPGVIGFGGIWKEIGDAGVIDAVKSESFRVSGYYWFLVAGFLVIIYGLLCHWVENRLDRPLPSFAGWGLLAVACFCVVLDVDTGFWLVMLVAINMIVSSRRARRAA